MAEIAAIMAAIADQLENQLKSEFLDLQVWPLPTYNPTPPTIDVYPAEEFQAPLGFGLGNNEMNFTVRARVNTPDIDASVKLLLAMMDPTAATSVQKALAVDDTLGGVVESSDAGPASGFGNYVDAGSNGQAYLGCIWNLKVTP